MVQNKHNHLGWSDCPNSTLLFSPSLSFFHCFTVHYSRLHHMSCSCFSSWLLLMRSLKTLSSHGGLNFLWLPVCSQWLSLIDQPAVVGGRPHFPSLSYFFFYLNHSLFLVCFPNSATFHERVLSHKTQNIVLLLGSDSLKKTTKPEFWESKSRLANLIKRGKYAGDPISSLIFSI